MSICRFIPPYLLQKVASEHVDPDIARCGHATLAIDEQLRTRRTAPPPVVEGAAPEHAESGEDAWVIYTASNGSSLPGKPVRSADEPESGDVAVDEASAGVEASLGLFREGYHRDSYDGRGAPVIATVHYEKDYDNAFWDGRQLVFGDGDGKVFDRLTKPVDVLAHELSHAVTQYTADLAYEGQSGALNESVSDVFGSCLKQRVAQESVDEADWLIGEGIFMPSVRGVALRSMKEPGTAYDDPSLGKDPQVATMDDYVDTDEDNGGVHTNSGIPNKAFYLAATALGGSSWDGAGRIWYAALTSGLAKDTDFAAFATATVAAAADVSAEAARAVTGAWSQVGVTAATPAQAPSRSGADTGPGGGDAPLVVAVTRSGGFAGIRQTGELTLGDDPRTPEVESLLDRIDLRSVAPATPPQPDRYVFTFHVRGEQVVLGEADLTPDLRQLATLLLP
jgi:hypothetical protein